MSAIVVILHTHKCMDNRVMTMQMSEKGEKTTTQYACACMEIFFSYEHDCLEDNHTHVHDFMVTVM